MVTIMTLANTLIDSEIFSTIANAFFDNAPIVGLVSIVLIYNHIMFRGYQKSVAAQSQAYTEAIRSVYENANKDVIENYVNLINDLKSHIAYLKENHGDARTVKANDGKGAE